MRLFISYAHDDQAAVEELIGVLKTAHDVWYDRELIGGQVWWDTIIEEIRECGCFIIALTPKWQNSMYCAAEWTYAANLNKTIVPIRLDDRLLLPGELNTLQHIKWDQSAAPALLRQVSAAMPSPPLPDPLPASPPCPLRPLIY